ncbi:MAG: diacylglycerol kinase [Rhodothalassiaceae bacterium]|nr:MAG: diacylglycerol kinase [Rhodothalassiaceae bacterium]
MQPFPQADGTMTAAEPVRPEETAQGLVGVLTNTGATRVRRSLKALREAIGGSRGVLHVEIRDPGDVPDALRLLAASGVSLLCINGGDGTVQMVAEALDRGVWRGTPPPIAVLAGGHTNLIATDLGTAGDPLRVFARLLAAQRGDAPSGRAPRVVTRVPVRIEGGGLARARAGFFVGLAGIPRATDWARRRVQHPLVPLWLHDAASILLLAASALLDLGRSPLAPVPLAFTLEDGRVVEDAFSVAIATSLPRLLLGARLFARHDGETVQFAAFSRLGPALVRALMAALRHRLHLARMKELTLERVRRLVVAGAGEIVVDGEIVDLDPGEPLVLSAGRPLRFLALRADPR